MIWFERAREQVIARPGDERASDRLTFESVTDFGGEVELKVTLEDLDGIVPL